jgi:DNA-binding response OmpR family regulator
MAQQKPTTRLLEVGDLVLDLEKTTLNKGKTSFKLTPKETKLLAVLMENEGKIVSRDQLITEVWYSDATDRSRSLDVHIRWLRQKVEDNPNIPEYILTRRGLGYEFRI